MGSRAGHEKLAAHRVFGVSIVGKLIIRELGHDKTSVFYCFLMVVRCKLTVVNGKLTVVDDLRALGN